MNKYRVEDLLFIEGHKRGIREFKNILLVSHHVSHQIFGGERSFIDLLEAFSEMQINVFVSLPGNNISYTEIVRKHCIGVYIFNYKWWQYNHNRNSRVIKYFADILIKHNIDVVHSNTIVIRDAVYAARRMNVTSVIHVRELIRQDDQLRMVIGAPSNTIISETLADADWIIANSNSTKTQFPKPGRTLVLYNTVSENDLFTVPNIFDGRVKIGIISSNMAKKGIIDFIAVAQRCHLASTNAKFFVIGPQTKLIVSLRNMLESKKIFGDIKFLDYTSTSLAALSKVNVVVNLSHFAESFGRTIAEAMAAGRPVIAYNQGAVSELVHDGKTGYTVPVGDIEMVAQRIQLICENSYLIEKLGRQGRQECNERFSKKIFRERLDYIYSMILSSASSKTPIKGPM